jgi:hypothetical protein
VKPPRKPSLLTRTLAFFVWLLLLPFMWRRRKAWEYPEPTCPEEVCSTDGCPKRCMIVSDGEPSRLCIEHGCWAAACPQPTTTTTTTEGSLAARALLEHRMKAAAEAQVEAERATREATKEARRFTQGEVNSMLARDRALGRGMPEARNHNYYYRKQPRRETFGGEGHGLGGEKF